eukprot:GDKI01015061.1.p1 GENE.GDKI01015061.1~~GDKI01015061.1.p1  ORF type:complete len:182 (+),score=72.17 GDKI01015061.1:110-655(+)
MPAGLKWFSPQWPTTPVLDTIHQITIVAACVTFFTKVMIIALLLFGGDLAAIEEVVQPLLTAEDALAHKVGTHTSGSHQTVRTRGVGYTQTQMNTPNPPVIMASPAASHGAIEMQPTPVVPGAYGVVPHPTHTHTYTTSYPLTGHTQRSTDRSSGGGVQGYAYTHTLPAVGENVSYTYRAV